MEAVKGLRLPSCYVEVTDNEIEYLDGEGLNFWQKVAVVGIVIAAIGAVVALGFVGAGALGLIASALAAKGFIVGAIMFNCGVLTIAVAGSALGFKVKWA